MALSFVTVDMYVLLWPHLVEIIPVSLKPWERIWGSKAENGDGGRLSGLVGWASNFSTGHDFEVRKFKPHIKLSASAQNLLWILCLPLSLLIPPRVLALSLKSKH